MDNLSHLLPDDTIYDGIDRSIYIEIDWQQYFADFCEAHGKYPVVHNGVLLFPDGWRYSMTDYQGPEYPPPETKKALYELQLAYYVRRLEIVKDELRNIQTIHDNIENLQRAKNIPLKQSLVSMNDEGQYVTESVPLDTIPLRKRLEWLHKDVDECKKMIADLKSKFDNNNNNTKPDYKDHIYAKHRNPGIR